MHNNLINSVAWGFSNGNPQLFEELHSEAILAYLEAEKAFNPEKGVKFTTFAFRCMTNRLNDFTKKSNGYLIPEQLPDIAYQTTPFFEILESMSIKAQFVVNMIFSNLENYSATCPPRKVRGQIRQELSKLGWSPRQQTRVINELKEVFS